MVSCAVAVCKNTSGKITKCEHGITFHRFPRDSDRRRQWEQAVNREQQWRSTPSSAVCSEHFEAKDFYLTESGLRRLSLDAVPSINISPCQQPEPTLAQRPVVDVMPHDSKEVIKLKYRVRRLEALADLRKRRLNLMWQSKRRLEKKLEQMKYMPCQQPEPTLAQRPVVDVMPYDSKEVIKLKYRVRRLEALADLRKRRLNLMWQSKRRLEKKLEQMKYMGRHLIINKRDKKSEALDR